MWVKISENNCVNLGQAECVIVHVIKELDPSITDSPVPAQNAARFDVEALFPDGRRYVLASFPVCLDCGHYQAEAKADEVFVRIMRAIGAGKALLDLMQPGDPRPSVPAAARGVTEASPIRFAM